MRNVALLVLCTAGCDTVDDRPASWSYVHAGIIAPNCATASCHSQVTSQDGFDFSTRTSAYAMFTGRTCGAPQQLGDPPGNLVTPGALELSPLLTLLRGEGGLLMPPDAPLADVEIELVERWILAGAPCD